jgi:CHASE2 domain-containing sensor protein
VLTGKIPASKYADKIVLIGATAAGVGTTFPGAGLSGLTPVEMMAHVTSSILASTSSCSRPGALAAFGAFLLVAGLPDRPAAAPVRRHGRRRHRRPVLALLATEFGLLSGARPGCSWCCRRRCC